VCDRCGHVQIATPSQAEEINELNRRQFSHQYDPRTANGRAHDRLKKLEVSRLRLALVLPRGGCFLDVGAGEGWAQGLASEFGLQYCIVEANRDLATRLSEAGAIVAADSIPALLPTWSHKFSVVFLRAVLEHLSDPIGSLKIIAECIAPNGFAYVSVPNFATCVPKDGFTTDYLRPDHISYFTANKLAWCLHLAGLTAAGIHCESDLWAVARVGQLQTQLQDESKVNVQRIRELRRQYLLRDAYRTTRLVVHRARTRLQARVS
jgi:SAM-dependent methyltransferase